MIYFFISGDLFQVFQHLLPVDCRFLFDGVKVAEFAILEDTGRAGRIALGVILTIILVALIAGLAAYAYHR